MATRLATPADAATVTQHVLAVPNPPYYGDDPVRYMEEFLARERVFIDDKDFLCWIDKGMGARVYTVVWLLPGELPAGMPQGEWDSRRAKLLQAALRDAHNLATPDEKQWLIEARFHHARNAQGVEDGGREAVLKWQAALAALLPGGTKPIVQRDSRGAWTISWTLQAAKTRIDRLL